MDPLSISAALVTFLGASATVVGFLEELCSLRKAPAAILALNNEISDLRLLFHGLNNLTQQRHDVSIASSTILPTLEKAQEKVRELEVILERRVIKRQLPSGQTEIDRIAWLRNKPKIQEIHDSFRDVKLNIATALGAVSSLSSLRLHARLQELQQVTREARAEQQNGSVRASQACARHEEMCIAAFGQIIQAQRRMENQVGDLHHAVTRYNIAETPKTHISEEPSPAQSPGRAGEITPTGSFKVSMSYSGSCLPRCRCICHRRQMMRSSQVLEGIIGALFIGYVDVSILSPRCDRIDCKRPTTSGISINYFFPSWFVLRVLFFTIAFASHDDPEPGLGLPRVRPDDALIFEYSVKGSTQGVRFLLETGRASPYDVNPRGRAPLTLVMIAGQLEICHLLLQAGADPYQEDPTYGCAYDYAWRKTLGGGEDALSLRKLRLLFSEDEYLDTHELTFLQRVVIGTIPLSLNGVLNNMPVSEINRTDADGRTALIWAATRGDHSCVELLLGRGATHQMVVRKSLTALTEAAISGNEQCVKLLVEAGADINYTNSRGYTALHEAARSHDNPAVVAILLEHSANINSQTKWNAMALMYATHSMHHRTAAYLINYGADYHLRDLDGVSALCYSIWKNDLATLRLLLGKGADHTIRTNNGMTVLHYAAWDGDIHTIQILIQARLTGIDVSAVARGVTALQAAESRVERAWGVSGEWMEGFNALWESAQPITLRNCEAPRDFEDDAASREDMFVDALEQQEILNYGSTPLQTS